MKMEKGILEQWGVSLAKLSALTRIVEFGSASAYSKARGVGEAQVSRQMRELATTLGQQLFVKRGRNKVPTAYATRVAAAFSRFAREVERAEELEREAGVVRIGVVESALRCLLAPHLEEIEAAHPCVQIEVHCLSSEEISARIASGELELGLVASKAAGLGLDSCSLGRLNYFLCCHPDLVEGSDPDEADVLKSGRLIQVGGDSSYCEGWLESEMTVGTSAPHILSCNSFSEASVLLMLVKGAAYLPGVALSDLKGRYYPELCEAKVVEPEGVLSEGEEVSLVCRAGDCTEVASVAETLKELCAVSVQQRKPGRRRPSKNFAITLYGGSRNEVYVSDHFANKFS
ncbi:LysR family transcriptional regulator [Pelagicoccus sp. NFK12]|uniref:LysR family transcriptional regulator n=1 Tax=Pelagicoccus enzymogenes TaxID=2773457 RepID=A0A927FC72_9BACT|nr:LysR family transcriptional regulator [Pelagicoccus enzymogenes]MBD5781661.1 LysR family transcriptional regulator [Pelagicoccus enzymogenes]